MSTDRDDLFNEAARLIFTYNSGSVSLLQRKLKLGYSRAGRIMQQMESAGIVGAFDSTKPRAVLIKTEDELTKILNS